MTSKRRDSDDEDFVIEREREQSSGRCSDRKADPMPVTHSQATSSSIAATLNSGGNKGGFRTEPGEHLVVVDE